jgi:hypothetical protein
VENLRETSPKRKISDENKPKSKRQRTQGERFQRVKAEDVEFVDERLKDNTYDAKGGSDINSYGWKASQDLIKVRGDKFRSEKNKKKRGSYRGGQISFDSHSIKF